MVFCVGIIGFIFIVVIVVVFCVFFFGIFFFMVLKMMGLSVIVLVFGLIIGIDL